MIKYAWKYDDGSYVCSCTWNFRCKSLEAAELTDTIEEWASCTADGKPVKVEVFAEFKYPWGSTRREI